MRLLFRNFGWKLAAVAASCVLWVLINGANDLTTAVIVPVQFRNVPSDVEIANDLTEQVHLILRGPSPLLKRALENPSPVVLDLSDTHAPSERTYTIDEARVRLPGGVTLEKAIPGQVRLRLERRAKKDVQVRVRVAQVPPGMRAVVEEVSPPILTIAGPETLVQALESVETDPIDVQALDKSGRTRVVVYSGHPRIGFLKEHEVGVRISLVPSPKN